MKKLFLSLGLGLTLFAGSVFANSVLEELNTGVNEILSSYQSQNTHAHLHFSEFNNEEDLVHFKLNGLYRKVGSQNTLELKIDNFSYNDDDSSVSDTQDLMIIFKGAIGVDLTKFIQDNGRHFIPMIISITHEGLKYFMIVPYGEAGSLKTVITSQDNENYTSMTALFSAKIDLSKLSEKEEKESVEFTALNMSISIDMDGLRIDGYVVRNPEYVKLYENERKLKEFFTSVFSGNEKDMQLFHTLMRQMEDLADTIVNGNYNLPFHTLAQFFPTKDGVLA